MHRQGLSADKARKLLEHGNQAYVASGAFTGNVSAAQRQQTAAHGQEPYAIVITCSDARVIPEVVFDAAIGDLFVIRVAGNVIDSHQLGSIEYAAEHLGSNLIVVLGHTHCGAVDAALTHDPEGFIKFITDEIKGAIGTETDPYEACCLNVRHSRACIEHSLQIQQVEHEYGLKVVGAVYDIETGTVTFLDD